MSDTQSSSSVDQGHADTIAGLRELIAWLEHHPEVPAPRWGIFNFRDAYRRAEFAREDLTVFAAALGDRATETVEYGNVVISGEFPGGIEVHAKADLDDLADKPAPPKYQPIITRTDPPVTPEEDEAWGAAA